MMRLKILLCFIVSFWMSDVSYASENIQKETAESFPVTLIAASELASDALSQMPDPKTFVKKQWPAPEHTLVSHVELMIMHAILSGLAMNVAISRWSDSSPSRDGFTIMAAAILGGVASGWLSSEYSLTSDDIALFNKAALWGLLDGYMLLLIAESSANDQFSNPIEPGSLGVSTRKSRRPQYLFPLLGYSAGIALGLVVYNSVDDRSLYAGQINAASWIGAFSGAFTGLSMVNYFDKDPNDGDVSGTVLLVSNLGVAAGLFLFNDYPISESRVSLVAASGILLGGLAYAQFLDDSYSSKERTLAVQLGGLVGLVGGWFLTSQWDDDWIPDAVSDMHLGVMPNEHGGMMGMVSGRF